MASLTDFEDRYCMDYTYRIFNSIDDVDLAAWERLRHEAKASPFTDPRFVGAVEASMTANYRFQYVVVYERSGRPVAFACLTIMTIDVADFADEGLLKRIVQRIPASLSRLRYFKTIVCGLPISTGHGALALTPQCDGRQVFALLEKIIGALAVETKANTLVYKEFENSDLS